jgi:hypothetical protein
MRLTLAVLGSMLLSAMIGYLDFLTAQEKNQQHPENGRLIMHDVKHGGKNAIKFLVY